MTPLKTTVPDPLDSRILTRILEEGYGPEGGPGAWHGPDLAAALADVGPGLAWWRPAPGRHNIAELALHHAYYQHSVLRQLSSAPIEPFPLPGDDFFDLADGSTLSWQAIRELVATLQQQLAAAVAPAGKVGQPSVPTTNERFDVVLGITCHAIYHAGQIQLIRRLKEG